jgi:hypothetical protein
VVLSHHRTAEKFEVPDELWPGEVEQHDSGDFLRSFEDNLAVVRGGVEVVNSEVGWQVGQLPLRAGIEAEKPQILMLNLSSQKDWQIAETKATPCVAV